MRLSTDNLEITEHFRSAYELMEKTGQHVFLTGKAGTGKSTLLQFFRENSVKNVVVLAPTGVAAVNVKGQTIHSFFRFRPDTTPETVENIRLRKLQRKLYQQIDTIIIDEISMVRADLLDCVDAFLRLHGKQKGKPFGGVQMIFIGDLFQLPPVVTSHERDIFINVYKSPYFFDSKVFSQIEMAYLEFKKIYRQKEEGFIQLLGAIRNNTATVDHLKRLNGRYLKDFQPSEDDFYIYLTTTNAMANSINQEKLAQLKTRSYNFDGRVLGEFDEKNLPTHLSLGIKFHAQVMLLNNDPSGRWVNGSIGKIVGVVEDEEIISVELTDGKRVEIAPFTWEMFRFKYNEETEKLESESVASFTQYPLKLAWAVTIHKAQGKTFDKVVIDIGNGAFSHGQTYVALSRCSSFEGLVLKKPIDKRHILLDERVVNFMKNMKSSYELVGEN